MPRLSEVSVRPGKSRLRSCTPCGSRNRSSVRRAVSSAESAVSTAQGALFRLKSGSPAAYSVRSTAAKSSTKRSNAGTSAAGTATFASQARQITLSNWPPRSPARRRPGTASRAMYSTRPIRWFALARPLSISTPEWPPSSPAIESLMPRSPSSGRETAGSTQSSRSPPAQQTVNTPSSSESMLSSSLPLRSEQSSPAAPSMPTSSSTVNTASSGSPSVRSRIGSRAMSSGQPSAFAQTMSRWPCRMTGAACSQPGEASFQMTTLLSASCRQRSPCSLAKRTHRSLTCFVLPLPCGTELRYSKYEKTSFGSRFDNTPMLCPVLSVDTLFYHMRGALSIRRRRVLFFARHLE